MGLNTEFSQGIGSQKQIKVGTLRYDADRARYMITGEKNVKPTYGRGKTKPDVGTYNTPGRGVQGESSN
jgi:hypothetical protein